MALPEKITAKISSEAAGYISISPVRRAELPLAELVEHILALTGKDTARIRDILRRGSFVSGASRYRWEPFKAEEGDIADLLSRFPDPQPERPFKAALCTLVIFRGQRGSLELPHDVAARRRLFRKQSFWDVVISTLEASSPDYDRYSYSERADVYLASLPLQAVRTLEANAKLLKYSVIAKQLRDLQAHSAELFVPR